MENNVLDSSNYALKDDLFQHDEDLVKWLLLNVDSDEINFDEFENYPPTQIYDDGEKDTAPSFADVASNNERVMSNHIDLLTNNNGYEIVDEQMNEGSPAETEFLADSSQASARNAKKRRSDRTSSTRYRENVEELERLIKRKKEENEELHAHVLTFTQRTTELQRQRLEMENIIATKLMESQLGNDINSTSEELEKIVKKFTDMYADYGQFRQKEVR